MRWICQTKCDGIDIDSIYNFGSAGRNLAVSHATMYHHQLNWHNAMYYLTVKLIILFGNECLLAICKSNQNSAEHCYSDYVIDLSESGISINR